MRLLAIVPILLLAACASAPAPVEAPKVDPTQEGWYSRTVAQLAAMDRQAEALLQKGKRDEAAAVITAGEPLVDRLLAVPRPTLEAMEAASDLDQLYGRMLLENGNYGWARMMFQKNQARWRTWKPQTPETARRLQLTQAALAECDRRMGQ